MSWGGCRVPRKSSRVLADIVSSYSGLLSIEALTSVVHGLGAPLCGQKTLHAYFFKRFNHCPDLDLPEWRLRPD